MSARVAWMVLHPYRGPRYFCNRECVSDFYGGHVPGSARNVPITPDLGRERCASCERVLTRPPRPGRTVSLLVAAGVLGVSAPVFAVAGALTALAIAAPACQSAAAEPLMPGMTAAAGS